MGPLRVYADCWRTRLALHTLLFSILAGRQQTLSAYSPLKKYGGVDEAFHYTNIACLVSHQLIPSVSVHFA